MKNKFLIISTAIIFSFAFLHISLGIANNTVDTDNDGYSDEVEISSGYSPYNPEKIKFSESDVDQDGVSDYFEYLFKTDPFSKDSDGDGYDDFTEIDNAYDPLSDSKEKMKVRIEIDLSEQKMFYYIDGIRWREFLVSTGKSSMKTPTGEFVIKNKINNAWSRSYGLWMPFWMGLEGSRVGIHELPYWPNGYREGENHLGQAVSHGCIRLGIGAAEYVYKNINIGDRILIKE